jgi:hypothetical protein
MHQAGQESSFDLHCNLFAAILSVAAAAKDFSISYLEGLQGLHPAPNRSRYAKQVRDSEE